ncbi:tetratricopeptide repeat protein [uncultured Flavobacterium sp.]|uniref:tetratricopeptide repeat protein n=1 Tax=uncultured Flavobacterium sp. TaxID=165435 RepID=UPI0025D85050|nr:tetratricopeptide repeat protein [uncultured Flavobacterium sp.]
MKKIFFYTLALAGTLSSPAIVHAQAEPDSLSLARNEFQEDFYEALKQKGIENYDKAIQSLQKCIGKEPENPVLYNELGKNYFNMKNFAEAERAYTKATQLDPKNRWYWQGLYDVYYETKNYNKAIPTVLKLMEWKKEYYQEDLVSLYMYTHQFDKALSMINEMESSVGMSEKREMYKAQIMSDSRFKKPQKEALEEAIKKNPKVEANYLDLIYLYSESNEEAKAEAVARQLEKEIPGSDWAQVSLFKFHIGDNDGDKASESMFRVLESRKIDSKIKHRVLNEFLIFAVANPKYSPQLDKAVGYFEGDKNVDVAREVGKFLFNKKKYADAARFFEKSLESKSDDIETVELLLYSYAEGKQFDKLAGKAAGYLDLYPTHARLYYFAGQGANGQAQFAKAKKWLEEGMDYIVEDKDLEAGFKKELTIARNGLAKTK